MTKTLNSSQKQGLTMFLNRFHEYRSLPISSDYRSTKRVHDVIKLFLLTILIALFIAHHYDPLQKIEVDFHLKAVYDFVQISTLTLIFLLCTHPDAFPGVVLGRGEGCKVRVWPSGGSRREGRGGGCP